MAEALQFPDHWKEFVTGKGKTESIPLGAPAGERLRVLIADDDSVPREMLAFHLDRWGYDVLVTRDGSTALEELRRENAPPIAILDWMMPGISGPEICRRLRETDRAVYIILLTVRRSKEDVVEGLQAGADDYLVKPFDKDELHARIQVGMRIVGLQRALAEKVRQLEILKDPERQRGDDGLPLV